MRGVRTTINPRVLSMCRAGKKPNVNSSIPVLNFSFRIKNKGKGTAYMNRDGVIVSAQQTNDFHERVFSTSKYYLGGKGGPGHFINSQGNRQNWILKKMAHVSSGKVINASSHLGISYNNRTFTVNRLQELAGQTHKFLLKLTSYGKPGLKESNNRNNKMLVSFTFPRNFCFATARPITQTVSALLPDLKIVQVKPKLHPQAVSACKTNRKSLGGMMLFDVTVKNIGKGVADLGKLYAFNVFSKSSDSLKPTISGVEPYYYNVRNPATSAHGRPNPLIKPGQTFKVETKAFVKNNEFPSSQYDKLAGKTRRFTIKLGSGKKRDLKESNYNNNSKTVRFTFPRNFCKATLSTARPITQQAGTISHDLVIQSVRTRLKRPYECRPDGPTMAYVTVKVKNKGTKFDPSKSDNHLLRISRGSLNVGTNRIILSGFKKLTQSINAGQTATLTLPITGTAGLLHRATPPLSSYAGKIIPFDILLDGKERSWTQKKSKIHFPTNFCK